MPARPFAWAARCFCRLRHLRTASSSRQNCSETNLPAVVTLSKRSSEMNPSACSRSAFNPATRSMYSGNLPSAGVNSKMTAIIGPPGANYNATRTARSGGWAARTAAPRWKGGASTPAFLLEADFDARSDLEPPLVGKNPVEGITGGEIQGELLVGDHYTGAGTADALLRKIAGLDLALVVEREGIHVAGHQLMRLHSGVVTVRPGNECPGIAAHRRAPADRKKLRRRKIGLGAVLPAAPQRAVVLVAHSDHRTGIAVKDRAVRLRPDRVVPAMENGHGLQEGGPIARIANVHRETPARLVDVEVAQLHAGKHGLGKRP